MKIAQTCLEKSLEEELSAFYLDYAYEVMAWANLLNNNTINKALQNLDTATKYLAKNNDAISTSRFTETGSKISKLSYYSSGPKIQFTGHTSLQAPQSMHSSALITLFSSTSEIQLTGHTPSQAPQLIHSSLLIK